LTPNEEQRVENTQKAAGEISVILAEAKRLHSIGHTEGDGRLQEVIASIDRYLQDVIVSIDRCYHQATSTLPRDALLTEGYSGSKILNNLNVVKKLRNSAMKYLIMAYKDFIVAARRSAEERYTSAQRLRYNGYRPNELGIRLERMRVLVEELRDTAQHIDRNAVEAAKQRLDDVEKEYAKMVAMANGSPTKDGGGERKTRAPIALD
jgi:hypothetical protein